MSCEETRALAPELALGIAAGEERAEALRHLARCPGCRRELAELAELADGLLMLAPEREPPAGFESRALERIGARPPRARRARRWALRLAPPALAALVVAVALLAAFDDERELAGRYRDTLAQAGGEYFRAEKLRGPGGVPGGVAFGYQGRPSWVMVVVDAEYRDGRWGGELVTRAGQRMRLPAFRLDARTGTWGGAIPSDLHGLASIRLVDRRSGQTLEAQLPRD